MLRRSFGKSTLISREGERMTERPFWEAAYADSAQDPFGPPSEEIIQLAERLHPGSRVLDLGCGDGRHALFLAEQGCVVDAVDVSERGVAKLEPRAEARGLDVRAWVQDIRDFIFKRAYDLIIAHGVLHLLEREDWMPLLCSMREHTTAGGWNVIVVFTDELPPPEDLAPHMKGLFREGELAELYAGWELERSESYILEDEHPGGIRHRHPINKVVARKSTAGA